MALDINGYNATFKAFTDFATRNVEAGNSKAIARASADVQTGALAGRSITAAPTDSLRGLFKWFRKPDDVAANDATRKLFRDAIIDMFGGESKIPAAVKKAMIMADYDCGKPLTARRILAVKAAIDASGTTEARKLDVFQSSDAAEIAKGMGYKKSEMPKLARAAHFYAQATGVDELAAMKAVAEQGSKANRLMNYGGRFLESAQNFADGLRLMDSFATWFQDVVDTMTPVHNQERDVRDFSTANTLTKLNIDSGILNANNLKGLEKFVFEELASNPAHDLSGNDPEKLFGFKDNAAMRFIGRGYGESVLSTIANIPPAKRAVIYAAYDLFTKQAQNADEAFDQVQSGTEHRTQIETSNSAPFLARLLRNFDQLEAMHRKGALTARNVLNKFFPDIADKGNYDYKAINKYQGDLSILLHSEEEEGNIYADLNAGVLQNTMNNCGTTIEETAAALRAGKMPPIPKMLCTGSVVLSAFDGTTQGGRSLVAADADRPANYSIKGGEQDILKGDDAGFGFSFPDGTRLVTNGGHRGNIPTVCDKIENLCGRVHPAQASSVMMMLSQSGLTNIRGGIPSLGVVCNEHSAIEFSLSKDEKTGDVTIKYSSPAELPFRFSWTATVDVDGNVKTTPMVAEKPVAQLDAKAAGALVDGAGKKLGVNLTGAQKREAVRLLQTHGTNMYAKNAQLFANFIVKLVASNVRSERRAPLANDVATRLRKWRDFGFGDAGMVQFADAVKKLVNDTISEYMQPGEASKFQGNVHESMIKDANRGTYILNGTTYDKRPEGELVPAFKAVVTDPKKQKAISCYLHQLAFQTFTNASIHAPYSNGTMPNAIKGFDSLVNLEIDKLGVPVLFTFGHSLVHDLQVSPDGKTATITQSITADLAAPGSNMHELNGFGQVSFSQRFVIDLEPEIPTVIDLQISQTIA